MRPPPAPNGDCVLGRGTNDGPSQNFSSSEAVAAELRHPKGRSQTGFSSLTAAHGQLGRIFLDMVDVHTVRLAGRADVDVRRGSGRAPAPSRTCFRRRPVLGAPGVWSAETRRANRRRPRARLLGLCVLREAEGDSLPHGAGAPLRSAAGASRGSVAVLNLFSLGVTPASAARPTALAARNPALVTLWPPETGLFDR